MKSVCANCHWVGEPSTAFPDIPDLIQRIEPGGEVPSGECPECGALCYVVPKKHRSRKKAPEETLNQPHLWQTVSPFATRSAARLTAAVLDELLEHLLDIQMTREYGGCDDEASLRKEVERISGTLVSAGLQQ